MASSLSLVAVGTVTVLLLFNAGLRKANGECTKVDNCSCRDSMTGEVLSLQSLARNDGTAALKTTVGDADYWYNPCTAFTEQEGTQCENVALCQLVHSGNRYYNLGNQSTAEFGEADNATFIRYTGVTTQPGDPRISTILLHCEMETVVPRLVYVGEQPKGSYHFGLYSKCSCPGACPHEGTTCTPEGPKSCACRLGDGDLVNIRSLDQPSAPLIVHTPTATVTFNPCTGVNTGPGTSPCRDAIACLSRSGTYTDYGDPEKVTYGVQNDTVVVRYESSDGERKTIVGLVCDQGQRHYPKLTIVGEPSATELNLQLRSICACPGACFSPAVSCERVDDCSCKLSDGSGTVSLHELDNPVAPMVDHHVDQWNTVYNYYYNPCTNFTTPEPNDNCTDEAVCQILPHNGQDFGLGKQTSVQFRTSSIDSTVVTFNYQNGGDGRQSFLQLDCNATASIPEFKFVDEEPWKTYHFTLRSRYACVKTDLHKQKNPVHRRKKKTNKRL